MAEEHHHSPNHDKMADGKSMLYRYTPSKPTGRRLCGALIILLFIAGLTALILYLIYRPSRPHFTVVDAAVYQLGKATAVSANTPPANVLSTNMQITLASRNPSDRAAIYYDRLSAYVSYRGQPITPATPLPPLYQEPESTLAVSPILGEEYVPVSPDVIAALAEDEANGVVGLRLVLFGHMRYKAGPFWSGWFSIAVRCDVLVGFKKGVAGKVPLLANPECDFDS